MKKIFIFSTLSLAFLMSATVPPVFAGEALQCTFSTSSRTTHIYPPDISVGNDNLHFILSHIKKDGTAKLSGNMNSVDIIHIKGLKTHTFLEVTPIGNTNMTTLFIEKKQIDGKIPAVSSRHVTFGDKPIVSQNFGYCEPIHLPD